VKRRLNEKREVWSHAKDFEGGQPLPERAFVRSQGERGFGGLERGEFARKAYEH